MDGLIPRATDLFEAEFNLIYTGVVTLLQLSGYHWACENPWVLIGNTVAFCAG